MTAREAKPLDGLSMQVHRVAAPIREQVADQLRQAIVEMRLRPGQRLIERELIEQTGVSRTTIREVLRELTAEGLVSSIPNKGIVVSSVTPQRAAELYEVRAVLEGMAGRQFVENASEDEVRQLRAAFDAIATHAAGQGAAVELLEAKKSFYDTLLTGSRNVTIQEIVEGLQARVTVLRALSLSQPDRAPRSVAEMREIVEAVEARDAQRAADACARHVRQAGRTALDAMTSS
ncbi:GntR family transcriptional regulator [Nocardia sp. NPDC127579]|uniref:GntR family transcriptional regulator n=1 Tax=Nocardia sp. NPDC127579 TaxID=3345402 RepID=UPI00362B56CD